MVLLPKLSILIATYNSAKTLPKALDSILIQDYNNLEVVIVDGVSSDNTINIIRGYDSKFSVRNIAYRYISEKDNGIYDALNKAILLATGDYLIVLGSDDYYMMNAFSLVFNSGNNINDDVVYAITQCVDDKNNSLGVIQGHHNNLFNATLNHQSIFIKKSLHEKIGLYSLDYKLASDYDFLIRAKLNNASFRFIDRVIVNYGTAGASSNLNLSFENLAIRNKYKLITYKQYLIGKIKYRIKNIFGKLIGHNI